MEFLETSVFTRRIIDCMSDDEYAALQESLAERPDAGSLIPGTEGLRKIRWCGSGRGKRGGSRVIYYWWVPDRILLLFVYRKNEAENLTRNQLKQLSVTMKENLHE